MVLTASSMLPLDQSAPAFRLPDVGSGRLLELSSFDGSVLAVVFLAKHCPYVVHVRGELARLRKDYSARELSMVGICVSDLNEYPEDAPAALASFARELGFPICFDESQRIAVAYRAACTPDFFVFDAVRRLAYRGQLDASRPTNGVPVTGRDLRAAIDALLSGRPVAADQRASTGCSIKWLPGREPDYAQRCVA